MRDDRAFDDLIRRHEDFEAMIAHAARNIRVWTFGPIALIQFPTRWGVVRQIDFRIASIARMPLPQWGIDRELGIWIVFLGRTQIRLGRLKE